VPVGSRDLIDNPTVTPPLLRRNTFMDFRPTCMELHCCSGSCDSRWSKLNCYTLFLISFFTRLFCSVFCWSSIPPKNPWLRVAEGLCRVSLDGYSSPSSLFQVGFIAADLFPRWEWEPEICSELGVPEPCAHGLEGLRRDARPAVS